MKGLRVFGLDFTYYALKFRVYGLWMSQRRFTDLCKELISRNAQNCRFWVQTADQSEGFAAFWS